MNSNLRYPVYRVGPAIRRLYPTWLVGGTVFGVILVVNMVTLVRYGQASMLWTLLSLAVVTSLIFGYVASKRSATITTPEHIEARTLFSARRIAWHDIQAIDIKGGPKIGWRALVRDAADREIRLPHLDSNSVESLEDELAALRGLWEQQRGTRRR